MKALQIILLSLTTLSGCAKKQNTLPTATTDTPSTQKSMTTTDTLNYLALGDSYTIGEAVPQPQSFPYQLYSALNGQGLSVTPPTIIATTGWTTDDLISAIARSGLNGKKYAFVTLLIGVNDQYQYLSQDNYKVKFAEVLNTAISFAHGDISRVFVLSIPDYGVTPFAGGEDAVIGPEIDQFNAINKAISMQAGVHYVDITPISREAAKDPSLIAPDGLHPSGKMYQLWVSLLTPLVEARLKR
ncbi:lysophospholipase L1-like esterase [Mucilaginibacter frigoritolerans]|uniref:Lysophospholipase L1-like esterase n=1 Tax=Mucilaginibacter frigoritolerans TaxID=652788 RepID=A0A562U3F7_9SPHI|nr:SGNH/GDSL hydrolase family protein [Mucilaginibacter frigoritolerans]TWI99824.1 lysophospholipase L1-like esterase [Mucilaginibacter frigoritolerans]